MNQQNLASDCAARVAIIESQWFDHYVKLALSISSRREGENFSQPSIERFTLSKFQQRPPSRYKLAEPVELSAFGAPFQPHHYYQVVSAGARKGGDPIPSRRNCSASSLFELRIEHGDFI